MNPKSGILVVNRFELMRRAAGAGVLAKREPALSIPHDEVFRRYRGFDGLSWPELDPRGFRVHDGLAAIADYPLVDEYARALAQAAECDVIVLAQHGAAIEAIREAGWSAAGFDLGYFESEWSHFSIILNEVLLGVHVELRSFAGGLNEHLLLAKPEDAVPILTERNRLAKLGNDFEQEVQAEPIAVFLRPNSAEPQLTRQTRLP